jgi:hypothetical protein
MDQLSERDFKKMFRMKRDSFNQLLELLENTFMIKDEIKAINSSGSLISNKTKLACCLRWMAGGSYLDICFAFHVSPGSFYNDDGILWETMKAIDQAIQIGFPFDNPLELESIASGFSRCSNNTMTKCVLAIDRWVCHTRQPFVSEADFPTSYRNRKNCFGIVVLGGCDANLRFRMWSCVSSGSTNDIIAWEFSKMKVEFDNNRLPSEYYFIGDEAFTNCDQFMSPWSGHDLDIWKDSFNYHLSAMCQCIERAFGVLVQR